MHGVRGSMSLQSAVIPALYLRSSPCLRPRGANLRRLRVDGLPDDHGRPEPHVPEAPGGQPDALQSIDDLFHARRRRDGSVAVHA
jgi:hypothetical protein